MIVFGGHIVQLWIHGDGQHQLLHLRVLTNLLLIETTQHNDLLLVEKIAGDVTSLLLKS